jgi:hypothetical protein
MPWVNQEGVLHPTLAWGSPPESMNEGAPQVLYEGGWEFVAPALGVLASVAATTYAHRWDVARSRRSYQGNRVASMEPDIHIVLDPPLGTRATTDALLEEMQNEQALARGNRSPAHTHTSTERRSRSRRPANDPPHDQQNADGSRRVSVRAGQWLWVNGSGEIHPSTPPTNDPPGLGSVSYRTRAAAGFRLVQAGQGMTDPYVPDRGCLSSLYARAAVAESEEAYRRANEMARTERARVQQEAADGARRRAVPQGVWVTRGGAVMGDQPPAHTSAQDLRELRNMGYRWIEGATGNEPLTNLCQMWIDAGRRTAAPVQPPPPRETGFGPGVWVSADGRVTSTQSPQALGANLLREFENNGNRWLGGVDFSSTSIERRRALYLAAPRLSPPPFPGAAAANRRSVVETVLGPADADDDSFDLGAPAEANVARAEPLLAVDSRSQAWLAIVSNLDDAMRALPSPRRVPREQLAELGGVQYSLCGLFCQAFDILGRSS